MKKGFTLIELLAVIIILAIIALIATISVNSIISSSKSELSETQINRIEEIAKTYNIKEGMDREVDCVNVLELIQKGYVDVGFIKDPATREEMTGSVKIIKNSNKYSYTYQPITCEIPTCGDIVMDGTIKTSDITTLYQYINNMGTLTPTQKLVADVNSDGEINSDDLTLLTNFKNNWYVTLSCPTIEIAS